MDVAPQALYRHIRGDRGMIITTNTFLPDGPKLNMHVFLLPRVNLIGLFLLGPCTTERLFLLLFPFVGRSFFRLSEKLGNETQAHTFVSSLGIHVLKVVMFKFVKLLYLNAIL